MRMTMKMSSPLILFSCIDSSFLDQIAIVSLMLQLESSRGLLLLLRATACLLTARGSEVMIQVLASTSLLEGEIFFIVQSLGLMTTSALQNRGLAETPAFRVIAGQNEREKVS